MPQKWLKFAWIFIFAFYEILLRRLCFLLFSSSYETFWNASGIFISSRAKIWMTQEFKGRVHKKNQSWQQKWGFLILCKNSIFVPVFSLYTNLLGYLFKSKLHIFQTLVSSFLLDPSFNPHLHSFEVKRSPTRGLKMIIAF